MSTETTEIFCHWIDVHTRTHRKAKKILKNYDMVIGGCLGPITSLWQSCPFFKLLPNLQWIIRFQPNPTSLFTRNKIDKSGVYYNSIFHRFIVPPSSSHAVRKIVLANLYLFVVIFLVCHCLLVQLPGFWSERNDRIARLLVWRQSGASWGCS